MRRWWVSAKDAHELYKPMGCPTPYLTFFLFIWKSLLTIKFFHEDAMSSPYISEMTISIISTGSLSVAEDRSKEKLGWDALDLIRSKAAPWFQVPSVSKLLRISIS